MKASTSTGMNRSSGRWWVGIIFLILLFAGALLYQFVHQATTTISEALAEEVLEQQRDVAELLHQYSAASLAISEYQRDDSSIQRKDVVEALNSVSQQLEKMRSNYSFERLDGAAKAHAFVQPLIEDVSEWISRGIDYYDQDEDFVLNLASTRLRERNDGIRSIADETNEIAQTLISEQRTEISNFRNSLLTLLFSFAVLISLILFLLLRQRNLQTQIATDQQNRSQEIIEAEIRGRQRAEDALSESENILRKILDAIPENIAMIDSQGRVATVNRQWRRFVSNNRQEYVDGGIGQSFDAVSEALIDLDLDGRHEILASINSVRENGAEVRSKEYLLGPPQNQQWVEISALPFTSDGERHTLLVHENVTERRMLEARDRNSRAEMAHVSRLSSAGELATGLAHELNQPLTAISHNCHAALVNVKATNPENQDLIETLEDVYGLAQRAGGIIRSMRRFTQKQADERVSVNINDLIKETIRLTRAEAREKGVGITLSLCEGAPETEIDPVQIQQVLVNLTRNSVEAMSTSESSLMQLTISTELTDKEKVRVSVEDTGPGLSEAIKETLFSTFQTTKSESMGLGLAISRSIVEAHDGKLWVDKNLDVGVTFRFSLPLLKQGL